ncbi:hypothetical protein AvCA_23010 [Azotobacter vinelandii CA]|uniref:Uncharacterized protein n=2 Tax=Azotobacter vinelandii TaxID=354 RepID=C1DGH8_AZOVD|nr:hypothetical protein Avin_23010 [Azotobacter vinelandii DJ]AGK16713.1 hypothetical protein AvCA_23010 [Azotobacter vinelandii CA]AGK20551.1 hypothetical protein AvCA6_23010 [Azotobacter vinelandii CA6]
MSGASSLGHGLPSLSQCAVQDQAGLSGSDHQPTDLPRFLNQPKRLCYASRVLSEAQACNSST